MRRGTRSMVVAFFLAVLIVVTVMAWATREWVLTAVVVGFLFGFAMQRGGFCGSSLLSSFVLYRERRTLVGAGVAIAVAMLGFSLMAAAGWIQPNPKPFALLPAVIGGVVFGSGMVLAGGCVSGSLFKAGEGRVNSMIALVGIGIGANMVGPGLLAPVRTGVVGATRGISSPASIDQAFGLPYAVVGGVVAVVLLAVLLTAAARMRTKPASGQVGTDSTLADRFVTGGWSVVTAGVFIGALGWFAYLSSAAAGRNYPLGVTHGVMALLSLVVGGSTKVQWWLALEVMAVVMGSVVSAWLRNDLRLRSVDAPTLIVAFVGGLLTGGGAVLGGGCFVGNMLSGWALLSLHSLVFGLATIAANWVTTVLYLRGLR